MALTFTEQEIKTYYKVAKRLDYLERRILETCRINSEELRKKDEDARFDELDEYRAIRKILKKLKGEG